MENVEEGARNIHPTEVVGRLLQKSNPMDIPGNMTTMNYGDFVIVDEESGTSHIHGVLTPPAEDFADLVCLTSTSRMEDSGVLPGDMCRLLRYEGIYYYQKPNGDFTILPDSRNATYVALPVELFGSMYEEQARLMNQKMRDMRRAGSALILGSSFLLAGSHLANELMCLSTGAESILFAGTVSTVAGFRLFGTIEREYARKEAELSRRFVQEYVQFIGDLGIDAEILGLTNSL